MAKSALVLGSCQTSDSSLIAPVSTFAGQTIGKALSKFLWIVGADGALCWFHAVKWTVVAFRAVLGLDLIVVAVIAS